MLQLHPSVQGQLALCPPLVISNYLGLFEPDDIISNRVFVLLQPPPSLQSLADVAGGAVTRLQRLVQPPPPGERRLISSSSSSNQQPAAIVFDPASSDSFFQQPSEPMHSLQQCTDSCRLW
jgi:hypothetical protein